MEDFNEHFRHHHRHGWHGPMQARRGDIKNIILNVLVDGPMHGYDIIRKLEEKSEGLWKPSPGSVYPTLQLLEDEDLVTCNIETGKKIYTITDNGRQELKNAPSNNPWERWDKKDIKKFAKLKMAAKQMWPALMQINQSGDDKKIEMALEIIQKSADELTKLANLKD